LIVWGVGGAPPAAAAADTFLTGGSDLPRPVTPTAVALR
jgi:glutamate synthase (NADPH) small chain